MNQPNLLELARQGDPNAIAALINAVLEPKGITAKASLENACLSVVLESAKALNPETLVNLIYKGLIELEVESIQSVKIYGQKSGESSFSWVSKFVLSLPPSETLEVENQLEDANAGETAIDDEEEDSLQPDDDVETQSFLKAYLRAYFIPVLLVLVVAFLAGGTAAFVSTSQAKKQTEAGSSEGILLSSQGQRQTPETKQQAAESYLKAMNAAQENFYRQNNRFANTLEELERSANLISQSYDYVYRLKIINAARAQITAVAKEQELRSYGSAVVIAQATPTSIICRTKQPTSEIVPIPEASESKLACPAESAPVR